MEDNNKISYLDSIRGIASVFVLLSHLSLVYFEYIHNFGLVHIPDENYIQSFLHNSPFLFFISGSSAVYIFFIMSGIVLSISAKKKRTSIFRSSASRYVRLSIPATFSCLFAFIIYFLVKHFDAYQDANFINNSITRMNINMVEAVYKGSISSIFNFHAINSYNPVLWTMSVEFYCSILLYISYRTKHPILIMPLLSSSLLFFGYQPLLGGICFYIGMIISEINIKNRSDIAGFAFVIFGLYFSGAHNDSYSYLVFYNILGSSTYTILNFLGAALILYGVIMSEICQHFLSRKTLQKIGTLSFPIYLVHWPVIYLVFNIMNSFNIKNGIINSFISILITISTSILFSKIDILSIRASHFVKYRFTVNTAP
ncbi:acyltransferase family protein [Kluyvera ascorbata]|uniref:acyltransferase family protein n=1 Tax=Kluyvera ascorbata TaxID=51288 RepID=UPI0039F66E5D